MEQTIMLEYSEAQELQKQREMMEQAIAMSDPEHMSTNEIEGCIQDFRVFLMHLWRHLRLPAPTRMQLYIADYLQQGHKRSQLEALRGIGKTWITGGFVAWRLLRDPNEKVLIVSQSGGHAEAIAIFIKKIIHTMPLLEHLKARSDQKDATTAFDVDGCQVTVQPSVKALGITSQLQGNRATLLVSDDVEGKQNSATEVMRAKLIDAVAEYEAILQTDEKSQILVLGTPQSSESIYNNLRDKGYITRIFPARYPDMIDNYKGCLAEYLLDDMAKYPELIGMPCDSRFTDADLMARELSYGLSGFKLQYMLDTTLSDSEKYPLKLSDLIVTDLEPTKAPSSLSWTSHPSSIIDDIPNIGFTGDRLHRPGVISEDLIDYEGKILAIDPSGRGSDETGGAVVNHLHGKILCPWIGHWGGGYEPETLIKIAETAKKYEVELIVIESNFGDGMFSKLLQPVLNAIYPCTIEEIHNSIQKEKRIIDTLEPLMNQHRLVVDYSNMKDDVRKALSEGTTNKTLPYSLLFQMTHITKDRNSLQHDDRLDALTIGVQYWNEKNILKQDSNIAVAMYNKKLIQDELDRRAQLFKRANNHRPKVRGAIGTIKAFR